MHWLRALGVFSLTCTLTAGCAKGKDVKSAGKEDKLAFDDSGKGRKCESPSSSCDSVKDPSLDFKEKCREAGFRMKQCGCDNLCSGNINGDRIGFNSKNDQKTCKESSDKCETQETSAAYQDACDNVGGEMMECGCEWLCSKKLKEAIPDAPKEEAKTEDAGAGEKKADEKKTDEKKTGEKKADEKKAGKSKEDVAKEKAAKEKAAKEKAEEEKAEKARAKAEKAEQAKADKANKAKPDKSSSDSGKKEKSRFFNDE